MQDFQESSSVVSVYVKSICYNGLENMKSAPVKWSRSVGNFTGKTIQNPQSKIRNGRAVYVKTPCYSTLHPELGIQKQVPNIPA